MRTMPFHRMIWVYLAFIIAAVALSVIWIASATEADARGGSLPEEFVLADIRAALGAMEEVTGRRTPDDLLGEIFAGFCIGK